MMRYDEQNFLSAYIDEVKSTCTLSLCHFSLTPSLPLFLIPCFVLFLFSFASPSLSLALLFLLRSLPYSVCLLVAFWAFVPFLSLSLSLSCLMARAFLSRGAFWADCFRSLAFTLVRFCFACSALGRFSFARFPARLFVSLALRSLVFRSLAFPFVHVCFARLALARFSFARFPVRSFLFRSPGFCSFSFPPVRFCFARLALARFSFARFPARSLLFRSLCARSFFVRLNPTLLCAPFLVHLDVHLCFFLSVL